MGNEGSETFTERFNRLTQGLSRKQIGQLLDLTDGAVRKLQEGTTQSLKAHGAIALARHLGVPVEYPAERGPLPRTTEARPTPPAALPSSGTAARLPEGPIGRSVELLRVEIASIRHIAEAAQKDAREAKSLVQRRRPKSA